MTRVVLRRAAQAELRQARDWYESRHAGLGVEFDEDPDGFTREGWQEDDELVRNTCLRAAHEANAHLKKGGAAVTFHFVESDLEWNGDPCRFLLLTHEQARLAERLGVAQRLTSVPKIEPLRPRPRR